MAPAQPALYQPRWQLLLSTATAIAASTPTAHEDAWHVVEGYNAVMGEVCSADQSCRWVRAAGRAIPEPYCSFGPGVRRLGGMLVLV